MKIKISKESISFYRKPILIVLVSLLLYYALNNFIAAPRLAAESVSSQALQVTKTTLVIANQKLAKLNGAGLTGIDDNYRNVAALDKLVPQLPSEAVKADLLAQFIQLTGQTGTNGTLSFTGLPVTDQASGTTTIPATFSVQGGSAQIVAFLAKIPTLTPLVTRQTVSFTDTSSKTASSFTATGNLLVVGSSNAPIPLDPSGNPPAPLNQ